MNAPANKPPTGQPLLLSIDQAARRLGMSRFTLYYWAAARRIPHYRIGRRIMFAASELAAWVELHRVRTTG